METIMQLVRSFEQNHAALVGFGIRVLLVTSDSADNPARQRLAGLGSRVEWTPDLFLALEAAIDDPVDYGLLVMDCDAIGGLEAGRRAFAMLGETARRLPVILISTECRQQSFPEDRSAPTVLRAPLSAVSMRVGFEHALRERLIMRVA
jgi:hypothetical protein